jgi:hypothetical protein
MKTKDVLVIIFIWACMAGCKEENELKRSVFIYDPDYVDLPAYSEWGYNTFGAYYDREVFISNDSRIPAKVLVTDNSMSFILEGRKGYVDGYTGIYKEMSITFTVSGFAPAKYQDLAVLNDSIFDLEDPACQVRISFDTMKYQASILSGELMFKRVQNLQVDKQQVEVILSGYFGFKAIIDDKPVTVSAGRFDVGVGNDDFYIY